MAVVTDLMAQEQPLVLLSFELLQLTLVAKTGAGIEQAAVLDLVAKQQQIDLKQAMLLPCFASLQLALVAMLVVGTGQVGLKCLLADLMTQQQQMELPIFEFAQMEVWLLFSAPDH